MEKKIYAKIKLFPNYVFLSDGFFKKEFLKIK